jgi:hypothetical protein
MADTEIAIDIINEQIQHCEDIVNNIDNIVPKLYKIRQQAISQKNYISDINNIILPNIGTISNRIITLGSDVNFSSDVNTTVIDLGTIGSTVGEKSRKLIHSLFKFKHDVGTTKHFTTEQIGLEDNRTNGSNLVDIKLFTGELNTLLSNSNTVAANASGKAMYLPLRNISSYNYGTTLADLTPNLNTHVTALTDLSNGNDYVGFGLN